MLVTTPAIVLHAFPYGDTSKIVRLSTRDHGVQSVMAKGATRPRSRFGASLQLLSGGVACFYLKSHRDLHILSAFDVVEQRPALAGDLRRYAAAQALAELVLRCSPADPHPDVFDVLGASLDRMAGVDTDHLPTVSLAALWRMVATLGFEPEVNACVRCGGAAGGRTPFSIADGGILCSACGRGTGGGALDADDRAALSAFVSGSSDVPPLKPKHLAAHRRLLTRFIHRHLGEDRELKALAHWESQR